jgi:hypothetical protein
MWFQMSFTFIVSPSFRSAHGGAFSISQPSKISKTQELKESLGAQQGTEQKKGILTTSLHFFRETNEMT